MTVYVAQQMPNRDLREAYAFGAVKFLFEGYEQPSNFPGVAKAKMEKVLADYDPDTDYITTTGGDPFVLIAMCKILFPRQVNFLAWKRGEPGERGYYVPIVIK